MIRHVIHYLAAAAVLLHATLGCCAHEGHGDGDCVSDYQECEQHRCSHLDIEHSVAHHEHDTLASNETAEHHSPNHAPSQCDHARCQWPAPEVQQLDDILNSDLAVYFLSKPYLANEVQLLMGSQSSWSRLLELNAFALPVRPHLAFSVLLI